MNKSISLSVFEIVGSQYCVASDDAQKVYDQLLVAVDSGHSVSLSFRNVSILTSAFLNTAIGQLYSRLDEERIRNYLTVVDIESEDKAILIRVVESAKE